MNVKQFYDEGLAHSSYAIESNGKMILVDPARNPKQYYDLANEMNADIVGVIETHPHADFVSSHLQIHNEKNATIYVSKLLGADYPHQTFDEGDEIKLGNITLKALNTPGHSPDSITVLAEDENGELQALFTGDTLFIGDVGRPDLRENVGNLKAARKELAKDMYKSTRNKIMKLQEEAMVYPAHGSGSLCGKSLSDKLSDTLGNQKKTNPALSEMEEDEFVDFLIEGQPFVPKYFPYSVELNKKGAPNYEESISNVERADSYDVNENDLVIDARSPEKYRKSHIKGSINLTDDEKFESWLGAIVSPDEKFVLIAEDEDQRELLIDKASKIGYELLIKTATLNANGEMEALEQPEFKPDNLDNYTIIDVRNPEEHISEKVFEKSYNFPLPDLREKAEEIPTDKPVLVHCAAGYRSSAGTSIINNVLGNKTKVIDLSTRVKDFRKN